MSLFVGAAVRPHAVTGGRAVRAEVASRPDVRAWNRFQHLPLLIVGCQAEDGAQNLKKVGQPFEVFLTLLGVPLLPSTPLGSQPNFEPPSAGGTLDHLSPDHDGHDDEDDDHEEDEDNDQVGLADKGGGGATGEREARCSQVATWGSQVATRRSQVAGQLNLQQFYRSVPH